LRFSIFSSKKNEDDKKDNLENDIKSSTSEASDLSLRNYKSKFEIEQEKRNEPQKQTELYTRLEFYQNKLLQIDWRNRSLNLRRIYNKWCFDLGRLMIYDNTIIDKVVQSALSS
jgi:hypothetical protein